MPIHLDHYNTATLGGQLAMARDAILAHQRAMSVVGNNVANLNTEGYSRQVAEYSTRVAIDGNPGQIGMGAYIESISRVVDGFADEQVRNAQSNLGRWEAQRDGMSQVEEVFAEMNDYALSNTMDEFWAAWQDLAGDVDSITSRINLIEKADTMTRGFRAIATGLLEVQESLNLDMKNSVEDINNYASEIAELNNQIANVLVRGQSPNELMDRREALVKEMSNIAGVTVEEQSDGSYNVYLGQDILVEREHYRELYWKSNTDYGKSGGNFYFKDNDREASITGGEAMGKLIVRNELLEDTMNDLDELANTIRDRVNELHITGLSMNNTTGNVFFDESSNGAIDFAVAATVLDDPSYVAASATSSTGATELANDIYNLQFAKDFNNGMSDYSDFYRGITSNVGSLMEQADVQIEAATAGLEQADNWRESISGVSLDEEMANMIAFQRAFQASATVFGKIDELIASAIGLGA